MLDILKRPPRPAKRPTSPLSASAWEKLDGRPKREIWFGRRVRRYWSKRVRILLENARDYRRACNLKKALEALQTADVTNYPVIDNAIGGDWRPFRVERGLTGSMRGDICSGRFTGTMTTNMLDSSSVVFLQNEAGETLRVLIPSPATAREMLAQSLDSWTTMAGDWTDFWRDRKGTHMGNVIHGFAMKGPFTDALTHPEVIDSIDASCLQALDQRPVIQVKGDLVQKGVALASVLRVNGEQQMFVPTGFFRALTSAVRQFMPSVREPRLLAA